jgi:GntR family transcriptional regulator
MDGEDLRGLSQRLSITIDRDGDLPIGVQLAWALRARIGDGRFAPGQRLPGLRELAETLGINANTARSVYQRLEHEGLIDSRQGTGTFVADCTPRHSAAGQIAARAAREAHETGVDPREVAAVLFVTEKPLADVTAADAERRKELRTQIAALEQTLAEMPWERSELLTVDPPLNLPLAGPRLLSVEELEATRTGLVKRLARAEALLEATTATTLEPQAAQSSPRVAALPTRKAVPPRVRTRPSTA